MLFREKTQENISEWCARCLYRFKHTLLIIQIIHVYLFLILITLGSPKYLGFIQFLHISCSFFRKLYIRLSNFNVFLWIYNFMDITNLLNGMSWAWEDPFGVQIWRRRDHFPRIYVITCLYGIHWYFLWYGSVCLSVTILLKYLMSNFPDSLHE